LAPRKTPCCQSKDSVTSGEGAGLGLSIVASVARAHGGEATATANPGGGLTARVTLPTCA
ncbi:sensor histidine kinase, partial [Streptomyces cavourensis]|nr:sensor histidine kinase [Streptomyces cavourensis]